jgi:hypothetical protein
MALALSLLFSSSIMIVTTYAHTCSGSLLAFSALHHGMHSTLSSGAEEAGVLCGFNLLLINSTKQVLQVERILHHILSP